MREKRKGYKSIEAQMEAEKRYLKNNPEAMEKKRINSIKSSCKRFIREYASKEDLDEIEKLIQERYKKV